MSTITPPKEAVHGRKSVFLAGGITGCPDWQTDAVDMLEREHHRAGMAGVPFDVYNPRRPDFDTSDPGMTVQQIHWEHRHLRKAAVILFWFCAETLQPISLYELGAWSMTNKPIVVGSHPDYPRRQDVVIQTMLSRPDAYVIGDLEETVRLAERTLLT